MNIVVTGSLGHIGKPLATGLAQKGHAVTVISSQSKRQTDIEALGATAAIGSLEDVVFLSNTFTGADAVFVMVPPKYDEPDSVAYYHRLGSRYAEVIRQSGIKHVVHLSSYGAHLDKGTGFILGAHHVENLLNELPDVTVTHLRPGYFYYNLYGFVDMIKEQGILGANYGGDDRLILAAPSDIAAVAAEALTNPAAGTSVRYIVSDERTCHQAARILGEAIGKPDLQWLTFTDDQTKSALQQQGMPEHVAIAYAELGAAIHDGRLIEDYEQHKPATMGQVKLEEFAKEFAGAFKH